VVWSIIRDVGSYDKVLSGVTRVERLDEQPIAADGGGEDATKDDDDSRKRRAVAVQQVPKDDVIHVGMRYRIHRVNKDGATYFGEWDVTRVEICTRDSNHDDNNTASVNDDAVEESASSRSEKPEYSVTFFTANVMGDIIVSSTWSVRRSPEGDHHTIASIGIGYLPKRLFYMAGRLLCSCCLRRRAIELTEIDLNDIATAAESIAKQNDPVQRRPPS